MSVNKILVNNNDSNYTHSIFDISEYTGQSYSTLSDALDDIPQAKRKGGMTIRYVPTNDNKYVQYRFILSGAFTDAQFSNAANWLSENVDDTPTYNSKNLVKSGGVFQTINNVKTENISLNLLDSSKGINNYLVSFTPATGLEYNNLSILSGFVPVSENKTYTMVVQVNGKVRGKIEVDTSTTDEQMKQLAMKIENVKVFTEGKEIVKTIVVPKKLVNIVVK